MKKITFTLVLLAISMFSQTLLQAQERETRAIDGFTELSVSYGIDLFIRQGSSTEVVVKADANIIDQVVTEVEGEELKITMKKGNYRNKWWSNKAIEVYVTLPELRVLSASGGSDVLAEGLRLKQLSIRTSGGSDVELSLEADQLEISSSGGSDVELSGSTTEMKAKLSGGSDLEASQLIAEVCTIETSGGADADIYATKELSMRASGASDIRYRGNAEVLVSKASGAADIRGN